MSEFDLSAEFAAWTETSRLSLRRTLFTPGASGQLTPHDVQTLTQLENRSVASLMVDLLPVARFFARPPLSNFRVGAVARGASGALYLGANIELAQNGLGQTVHAEQSALANAYAHRESGITAIAVTAAPCGHCRQFLNELAGGSAIEIVVQGQPSRTLADLLPASFGPLDLGITGGMFGNEKAALRAEAGDDLTAAAIEAASQSYAPHTNAPSGCAVRTTSGRTYTGSYLENAAFNPSLPPLQSALVNVVFGGEDFSAITYVVLVEAEGARITHRPATEAALGEIAPRAQLRVVTATAPAPRNAAPSS